MVQTYNFYRVEKEKHIAWVYLNRPEKKNAMGPDAWKEIIPIFNDIDKDDDILVSIITAEGKDFCAGIDFVTMVGEFDSVKNWNRSAKSMVKLFRMIPSLQETMSCIEKCPKPVICAIHGLCIGAGLDLASACDIRLATEDTRISLREAGVAFVADVGSLQRVPLIVGQGIARELAFTAGFITAARAKEVNLVNHVYKDKQELLEAAKNMALEIASNAPLAVQSAKEVLNYCRNKSIEDGLEYVAARSSMIVPSEDLAEAASAFAEKRKPRFKGN